MGAAPHAFQIVVIAFIFLEEMDNCVAVIHQHPTAVRCAFNRGRKFAVFLFDLFTDIVSQRAQLAVAVTGANDKIIRDDCIGTQVEQNDIFGLFIFYRIDDKTGEFN